MQYNTQPQTATSANEAAQNRLTIAINLRFYDTKNPDEDLEQRFSFFFDFGASQTEISIRDTAIEVIYERITQDMLNATLAKW